jgi:hypothetical protein
VFELLKAPPTLTAVYLGDRPLLPADYAWDGKVLWVKATLSDTTMMRVEFGTERKTEKSIPSKGTTRIPSLGEGGKRPAEPARAGVV